MSDQQSPEDKAEAKIKAQQREHRIMVRSTLVSFVGVVLFASLGYMLYKITPAPYEEMKQNVILHTEPTINMSVLQQSADGGWGELDHTPNEGEKVAFRISSTHPIHVALLAEANHTGKRLVFDYLRIPPGENKMLKVGNSPYVYEVASGDEHVVFCMVVVTDPEKLPRALAPVLSELHLDNLPPEHCTRW